MRKIVYALSVAVVAAAAAVVVFAQGPPPGSKAWLHIPDSTIERLGDIGAKAHTNHLIHVDPQATGTSPRGQTPQTLWAYYTQAAGGPIGGAKVIAIVDAYHYGTALQDFNTFAGYFGLPTETSSSPTASKNKVFQVVYATTNGKAPKTNCGWAQEAALDIEWAHGMAPGAKIVLVEAASASFADLFKAVDTATAIVKAAGGGEVSMSWGGSEFSSEASYDSHFSQNSNVVYFASSGDTGGVTIYPGVSPNVVAAGGTSLVISGGKIAGEIGWTGSGGGPSKYELEPSYQYLIGMPSSLKGHRGVPDISYDADPNTGVSVYDSTACQGMSGWMVFGGTSVSSPSLAGLTNASGGFELNSVSQLTTSYASVNYFNDIVSGTAGSYKAAAGWDYVTGLGTPKTLTGM
jgi:subtilase family serine protease